MSSDLSESMQKHARFGWLWNGLEQFAQRGLGLVVSIVLARLLEPSDFGLIASVSVFMTISQQIIDGGIAQRILQKVELVEQDYNALFWANGCISLIMSLLMLGLSVPISLFFKEPKLVPITMSLSLVIFLMNAGRVQEARLARGLRFRALSLIRMCSVLFGCAIGLSMAFLGFGVWSLIGQQVAVALVRASALWFFVPWRSSGLPSWEAIKDLYAFGLPIAVSQTVRSFSGQFINVLIARMYSPVLLGFYDRGRLIPQNLGYSVQNVFTRTNFPVLAKLQHDDLAFRTIFSEFLRASAGINFMLMTALMLGAKEAILVLLGEKWLPGVWFLQVNAVVFMVYSVYMTNADVLRAYGKTTLFFRYNMLCALFQLLAIAGGSFIDIKAMVLGDLLARALACILLVLAISSGGYIRFRDQLMALIYPILGAGSVALVILGIKWLPIGLWGHAILMGVSTLLMLYIYFRGCSKLKGKVVAL